MSGYSPVSNAVPPPRVVPQRRGPSHVPARIPPPPHQSQSSRRRNGRCRSHRGRTRRRPGERRTTANGRSAQPGLRPQRPDLQPRHSPGRDPELRSTRSPISSATTRWARSRHAVYFLPGDYGTAEAPLQFEVGYYTEVAGLGASPDDVDVNGGDRGLQPLPRRRRHEQLPRARQLLAHDLEPLDRRSTRRARTDAARAPTSGRCRRRSRCAASRSPGANLSLMDYCTAGPQFASGGFIADSRPAVHDQRLAAAVADPQQRGRRAGATASGTRSSRASSAPPTTPASRTRRTRRSTRRRSAARSRTSSSTTSGRYNVRVPSAQHEHERHLVGRRRDRGSQHPDHGVLHRDAERLGQGHQQRARARPAPDPDARRLRHRPHDRGQARRHGRARHGPRDAHRRWAVRFRSR